MVRTTERRIDLFRQDGALWVRGGWPETTHITAALRGEFAREGTADLVEFRCVNGRAIYRVTLSAAGRDGLAVYRADLAYEETDDIFG